MNFITYYAYDNMGIFTEPVSFDKYGPVPTNAVAVEPPPVTEPRVAQWTGAEWVILSERPVVEQAPIPIIEPVIEPVAITETIIFVKIDYLKLFTQDERISIYRASLTNNKIRDYLYILDSSTTVSLSDIDIQSGLTTMESIGLLSTERAARIRLGQPPA